MPRDFFEGPPHCLAANGPLADQLFNQPVSQFPGFVLWFWSVLHPVLPLGPKHSRLVRIGEIAHCLFHSFSMMVLNDTVLAASLHRGFSGTGRELLADGLGVDAVWDLMIESGVRSVRSRSQPGLGSVCLRRMLTPQLRPQRQEHPCNGPENPCCWGRHSYGCPDDSDWHREPEDSLYGDASPSGRHKHADPKRINLPFRLHVVSQFPNRGSIGHPPQVNGTGALIVHPGRAAGFERSGFLNQTVDYAKESEPFAAHVWGLGSVVSWDGPGDAGKCADPSFPCSAVDFGLLQEGLGSHVNDRLRWRESASLQMQVPLRSECTVELVLYPDFELGLAFFGCWHIPVRQGFARKMFFIRSGQLA